MPDSLHVTARMESMKSMILAIVAGVVATTTQNCTAQGQTAAPNWREAEANTLTNHVQLTFSDRFVKAGESYFSPDDSKIIFQAVETPATGKEPDEFYAMYVADVKRDAKTGAITGLEHITRLSPKGSANTCGWFHPTDPNIVIFASTIGAPTHSQPRSTRRPTCS